MLTIQATIAAKKAISLGDQNGKANQKIAAGT